VQFGGVKLENGGQHQLKEKEVLTCQGAGSHKREVVQLLARRARKRVHHGGLLRRLCTSPKWVPEICPVSGFAPFLELQRFFWKGNETIFLI
jgi:hypothetical protein